MGKRHIKTFKFNKVSCKVFESDPGRPSVNRVYAVCTTEKKAKITIQDLKITDGHTGNVLVGE